MRLISLPRNQHIKNLTNNDVVHKYDVFDQFYIDQMLLMGSPRYFVNDHFTSAEFTKINFFGLPLFAECQSYKLATQGIFSNKISTNYCFNFMVNKKQVNRYLCMKLIELFDLQSFDYTWSGVDSNFDCTKIIQELDQLGSKSPLDSQARQTILSPIKITKKFIDFPDQQIDSNQAVENYGGNVWTWNNGLQNLFSQSAISLITESVSFQRASCFTEKTLYAVLGLTFPIWVGGYNQAKEWKRLGFDIFEDIVDHGYQDYPTLIERCYYAFSKNLDLLSNLQKSAELRGVYQQRLLRNRELLLQNQLGHFIDKEISNYPADLQQVMPEILKFFRSQYQ